MQATSIRRAGRSGDPRSDPKDIAEHVCLEVFPEPSEPHRLVEFVAVDREDPGVRPREGLDHRVRLSRMRDPSYLEMIELGAELAQNFGRSVGGHVVGNEDAIACSGDVEERLADEAVLVPDQRDPDDLHGCF